MFQTVITITISTQPKKNTENTYRVHRNIKEPRKMSGKTKENEIKRRSRKQAHKESQQKTN